jgi:hypothetical protein
VFENNDVFLKVDVLNCYAQANGKNTEWCYRSEIALLMMASWVTRLIVRKKSLQENNDARTVVES